MSGQGKIEVLGARVHNLKNVDVTIPRQSLTVITGLSGSGKSSLAFDTIFAEGQRRYIETFSAYARNFLGGMERPDVDKITGLSPVISIDQKTTNKNPRSTVGTTTEVYDYLRLLYARAGDAYSWRTGEPMVKYTEEQIVELLCKDYAGRRVLLLAPLVRNRKGHYRELFDSVRRKGFLRVRVDGELMEVVQGMKVDRYVNHSIEVVVDRVVIETDQGKTDSSKRLRKSVELSLKMGDGLMMVLDADSGELRHYSRRLMCPTTGMSYADPDMNKPVYDRLVPLTHFADGKSVPSDCRHILIAFGGDGKHIPIDLDRLRSANFDYAAIGGRLRPWMDKNAPIAYAGSLVSFDDDTVNHGYIMGTIDEEGTMIDLMPLTQEDEEGTRIAEESEKPEPEKKDQGITVGSPDDDAVTDYLQEIQKLEYENSGTGIRNAAIVFPFFGAALVLYAAQNLLPFDGIMTVVICIILAAVGIIVLIPLARARGRRKRQIRYLKKRYRMSRDDAEVIDDRIRG